MFFLKKALTYLILPPGSIILILLLIAYLTRGRERFASRVSFVTALLLYIISIEPFKDFLIRPLENDYEVPQNPQGDVIVVLGGGAYESGHLKGSSHKRTVAGFVLHKNLGVPVILSGGRAQGNIPESLIMKELLLKLGVEERFIYTDEKSRDTFENGMYVKEFCRTLGCKRIILVTSAFHMSRSVYVFEGLGLSVVPYPVDFRYDGKYTVYSYFPKYGAFYDSVIAVREYIGRLYYRLVY